MIFCSKVLPSSSGGQSAMAVAYILGDLFDQQLKGEYPTTGSGIFIELPMASGDSYKCWPYTTSQGAGTKGVRPTSG